MLSMISFYFKDVDVVSRHPQMLGYGNIEGFSIGKVQIWFLLRPVEDTYVEYFSFISSQSLLFVLMVKSWWTQLAIICIKEISSDQ